jgi:plasmid stability protein
VKNLTVSLPDDVYRRARIKAAERDTSVSALVRELLTDFTDEESEFDRRKKLQDEAIASIRSFRAGDRLSREEIHDRAAVR